MKLMKRLVTALLLLIASPAAAGDSNCGMPLPASPGSGFVAGALVNPTNPTVQVYWAKDAFLYGFDWFTTAKQYFPQVLTQPGALAPGAQVVDMAYATEGVMRFDNVVVSGGKYQISFRYAFALGFFPGGGPHGQWATTCTFGSPARSADSATAGLTCRCRRAGTRFSFTTFRIMALRESTI
jgi:hypothetical protein